MGRSGLPISRFAGVLLAGILAAVGCTLPLTLRNDPPKLPDIGTVVEADPARPKGLLTGRVVDADGRPSANVKVTAFLTNSAPLVSNNSGSLVSNNSGSLVSNNSGAYRTSALPEVATDARGYFAITPDATGAYNIEGVRDSSLKAWRRAVSVDAGAGVDVGNLVLAATGKITGRVRSENESTTDFRNTDIYIPGSSYLAKAAADGTFTISDVPDGEFELYAHSDDLGEAKLPNAQNKQLVRVRSKQSTVVPDLVLALEKPSLARLLKVGSEEQTDNGAPGSELVLAGASFGHSRGLKFQVLVNGVPATEPQRLSETRIRFAVPRGASTGQLLVQVGGSNSNPVDFWAVKSLALPKSLTIAVGGTKDLGAELVARDTGDIRLPGFALPAGTTRFAPNVTWTVSGSQASITPQGVLSALSEGDVLVSARAGDLLAVTDVVIRPPGQEASPAPSPTPSPTLTASPTPTPTPSPTPTPTPTPSSSARPAPIGAVTTWAGSYPGYRDGVGTSAMMYNPWGVVTDSKGTLYFTDAGNHSIRRIDKFQAVQTLAGAPATGSTDARGTMARFNYPRGIALDPDGNAIVADSGNHRIRKVGPDGTVSTVAGSTRGYYDGSSGVALFNGPTGVAVDAAGNIYVSDSGNNCIRKVSTAGKVTTVAGSPGANPALPTSLYNPAGISLRKNGALLVADSYHYQIKQVSLEGSVAVVAGSGNSSPQDGPALYAGFIVPMGVAEGDDGSIYVADWMGSAIRRVANGYVTTLAGQYGCASADGKGTAAKFCRPYFLTIGPSGELYVADGSNNRIRRID